MGIFLFVGRRAGPPSFPHPADLAVPFLGPSNPTPSPASLLAFSLSRSCHVAMYLPNGSLVLLFAGANTCMYVPFRTLFFSPGSIRFANSEVGVQGPVGRTYAGTNPEGMCHTCLCAICLALWPVYCFVLYCVEGLHFCEVCCFVFFLVNFSSAGFHLRRSWGPVACLALIFTAPTPD